MVDMTCLSRYFPLIRGIPRTSADQTFFESITCVIHCKYSSRLVHYTHKLTVTTLKFLGTQIRDSVNLGNVDARQNIVACTAGPPIRSYGVFSTENVIAPIPLVRISSINVM